MTTNQILIGIGLILVLAVGAQILASRLHIPAIIVLLPAGFIAGALTTDVNPDKLLGPAFEPLVSLSVAVILYDAGLGLDMRKLKGCLTDEDDFNALASVLLADCVDGRVYRLAPPRRSQGVVAPYTGGEILFGDGMTRPAVSGRYHDGARITAQHADGALPAGHDVLFLVRADGRLTAVTQTDTPVPQAGDTIVFLGPVPVAQPVDGRSQR